MRIPAKSTANQRLLARSEWQPNMWKPAEHSIQNWKRYGKKHYEEIQVSNKAWQYQLPKIPKINFTDRFLDLELKNSLCQRPHFYKPEFQILQSSKQTNIKH